MKRPASDRTVDMFAPKEAVPEALPEEEKAERVSIPDDADRMREQAFQAQEWTSKNFGFPDEKGNQYRMTHRGQHYYLESVSSSRYTGLMVHERDLEAVTTVFVGAFRARGGK